MSHSGQKPARLGRRQYSRDTRNAESRKYTSEQQMRPIREAKRKSQQMLQASVQQFEQDRDSPHRGRGRSRKARRQRNGGRGRQNYADRAREQPRASPQPREVSHQERSDSSQSDSFYTPRARTPEQTQRREDYYLDPSTPPERHSPMRPKMAQQPLVRTETIQVAYTAHPNNHPTQPTFPHPAIRQARQGPPQMPPMHFSQRALSGNVVHLQPQNTGPVYYQPQSTRIVTVANPPMMNGSPNLVPVMSQQQDPNFVGVFNNIQLNPQASYQTEKSQYSPLEPVHNQNYNQYPHAPPPEQYSAPVQQQQQPAYSHPPSAQAGYPQHTVIHYEQPVHVEGHYEHPPEQPYNHFVEPVQTHAADYGGNSYSKPETKPYKPRPKSSKPCTFFNSQMGCKYGDKCRFQHVTDQSIDADFAVCWDFNTPQGCHNPNCRWEHRPCNTIKPHPYEPNVMCEPCHAVRHNEEEVQAEAGRIDEAKENSSYAEEAQI